MTCDIIALTATRHGLADAVSADAAAGPTNTTATGRATAKPRPPYSRTATAAAVLLNFNAGFLAQQHSAL